MSTLSNRSPTHLRRGEVLTTQENGHSQSSGQFPERHKRQRRAPNELVWTQPRTIPANLHKNARRLSTPPEALAKKDSAIRGHSGQQGQQGQQKRQQQANLSSLLTPSSQSRDVSSWKMDTDFLDLGGTSDVADDVVQNLLQCSTNLPNTTSLATPQSLDQESYLLHVDSSYLDSRISDVADDSMDTSDNSIPAVPDSRLNLAGLSAIHLAAYFGKISIIRLLLSTCPEDVDLLNHDAQTPLHIAASRGHVEVIPELLRSGANALLQDLDGRTALHLAVSKGHFDVVRLLLDDTHGQAMIRMADNTGKTSLHQAVLQECGEIVRLLLERGADPRTPIG